MRASRGTERKNSLYLTLSKAQPAKVAAQTEVNRSDAKLGKLILVVEDCRLRRILRLIESHPSFKINDLALQCKLSSSRLQHLFKESTGFGLGQVLTEQRMQLATDFLVYSDMSIKEIASTVGYEHTSSFTRAFERHFRQAPSSYRQAQEPDKTRTDQEVLRFG
jgi:AraC-like DNA-binding protein